jgi:hypothetical protein
VFSAGVGLGHETYPSALHGRVVSFLHDGLGACLR